MEGRPDVDGPMKGRVCLVTGATSGIGKAAAEELARLGATVVVVGRDEGKCAATVDQIRQTAGSPSIDYLRADLSSQGDVRRLAREFEGKYSSLDVLVNNAGAIMLSRQLSVDNIEMTFALNHLAYFLLTNLLMDRLNRLTFSSFYLYQSCSFLVIAYILWLAANWGKFPNRYLHEGILTPESLIRTRFFDTIKKKFRPAIARDFISARRW